MNERAQVIAEARVIEAARAIDRRWNGREGQKFLVASASLDREAMVALRNTIDTMLGRAVTPGGKR